MITRMTKKEKDQLAKLEAKRRKAERERKAFYKDIDDNVDDVADYLRGKGYTVYKAAKAPDVSGQDKAKPEVAVEETIAADDFFNDEDEDFY